MRSRRGAGSGEQLAALLRCNPAAGVAALAIVLVIWIGQFVWSSASLAAAAGGTASLAAPTADRPDTPGENGEFRFLDTDDSGRPVRWRCGPIHFRTNSTFGPPDGEALAVEAATRVGDAAGLTLVWDGPTADPPPGPRSGRDDDAVWVGWLPADSNEFSDTTAVGFAAPHFGDAAGRRALVGSTIVLDGGADLAPGRVAGHSWWAVLLHEFGHLAGLDHVDVRAEVMYPNVNEASPGDYGPGDRTGLSALWPAC